MVSDKAVKELRRYRDLISESGEYFNGPHRALDTLSLVLLRGDVEKLGEYKGAVMTRVESHDPLQVSIDAFALIFLEKFPLGTKER
jgi:hypothetical protein